MADHLEVIADMELGVRRMSTLTNQLLVFARSESLQEGMASETAIPVASAIREVIAAVLPLAQEKGVELAMRSEIDALVCADRDALVTLLSNIADNAVRYSGPGARVDFSVHTSGDQVVTEIADNGPGLPEEMLTEVFIRFFRHNDTGEGSGLGLSIARALAERLNGSISLRPSGRSGIAVD